jgi:hypothetical protein
MPEEEEGAENWSCEAAVGCRLVSWLPLRRDLLYSSQSMTSHTTTTKYNRTQRVGIPNSRGWCFFRAIAASPLADRSLLLVHSDHMLRPDIAPHESLVTIRTRIRCLASICVGVSAE